MEDAALKRNLVLIGGGHSHVEVLRRFGRWPLPSLTVTLIGRETHTPYSGMLPGLVAGHYRFDEAHIDLAALCRFAGARLIHDEAIGLDPASRTVRCRGGPPIRYDMLSINIGSTPRGHRATAHAAPIKPVAPFLAYWDRLCGRVLAEPDRLSIGVVGAGAGGVEMVLAMQYRLRTLLAAAGHPERLPAFFLFGQAETVLPGHAASARRRMERILRGRCITVATGQTITETQEGVRQTDGTRFALDATIWITGAGPSEWLGHSGLALDERGFIAIGATMQSISHPDIFAAGDIATMIDTPTAKSGVYAVRQGPPLAANLRRAALGETLRDFHPQSDALALISTGNARAIATKGRWSLEGRLIWRWKDRIDRRFMHRYAEDGGLRLGR